MGEPQVLSNLTKKQLRVRINKLKMKLTIIFLILITESLSAFGLEEVVDNFVLTGLDKENRKKWELYGRDAYIRNENIILTTVKARIYEDNRVINIKADKGYLNRGTQEISLKENVILKDSQGSFLYTQVLNWDQKKKIIWTKVPLKLVKGKNEVRGIGGELETNLNRAKIKQEVEFKAIPQTIITSKGPLEVDYVKNIAVFNENVHVVDRKGELFCDTLIVYFDSEKKKVTKAHAKGNVRLRRGNSWSYSQEAIYDVKEGTVTLLGRPKLEIYPE